jgi:hypothetical protein
VEIAILPIVAESNGKPVKKKRQMSEEAKRAASERMKKLHAEGRAGPQFGKLGGRPRKKRASEVIAEAAADEAEKLLAVYRDAIDENQPISIRLKGAEAWKNIEQSEAKLGMEEEDHVRKMSKDELEDHIASKILSNPMLAGRVREMLEERAASGADRDEAVDAEVIEEDDYELEESIGS